MATIVVPRDLPSQKIAGALAGHHPTGGLSRLALVKRGETGVAIQTQGNLLGGPHIDGADATEADEGRVDDGGAPDMALQRFQAIGTNFGDFEPRQIVLASRAVEGL